MNKVILMGRLTRDAEIRYAQGDNSLAIARFSLAVDRRYSKNAAIQTRTDRRYTLLTSWLRMQSLQSLNQPHQEMQADLHRQTDLHLARLLGMAS